MLFKQPMAPTTMLLSLDRFLCHLALPVLLPLTFHLRGVSTFNSARISSLPFADVCCWRRACLRASLLHRAAHRLRPAAQRTPFSLSPVTRFAVLLQRATTAARSLLPARQRLLLRALLVLRSTCGWVLWLVTCGRGRGCLFRWHMHAPRFVLTVSMPAHHHTRTCLHHCAARHYGQPAPWRVVIWDLRGFMPGVCFYRWCAHAAPLLRPYSRPAEHHCGTYYLPHCPHFVPGRWYARGGARGMGGGGRDVKRRHWRPYVPWEFSGVVGLRVARLYVAVCFGWHFVALSGDSPRRQAIRTQLSR
jgi:hypothetical protein